MFGLKMNDLEMYLVLERAGLSVDEAAEMKKAGTLPVHMAEAWCEYGKWLSVEFGHKEGDQNV